MIENLKCPLCGGPMMSRKNSDSGQRFWGCQAFPKCRGTRNTDGESAADRFALGDEDPQLPSERARAKDHRRWDR